MAANDNVFLSNVRISFPKLVEATIPVTTDGSDAKKKFSADFITTPDNAGFKQFMAQYAEAALEKWGEHAKQVMGLIQGDRRMRAYGNGTEKVDKKRFEIYPGYEGFVYITASANEDRPPQIVNAAGAPVPNSDTMQRQQLARKIYGGCYVNAVVRPWIQDNKFGRAVRAELVAVQFLSDGEAFGGGDTNVDGMFGAVAPSDNGFSAPADTGGFVPDFLK
jgi:hypothetical protein